MDVNEELKFLRKFTNKNIAGGHFFIKYSIHHTLSTDKSFKFLAIILFEIRHFTKFHPLVCQRAVI